MQHRISNAFFAGVLAAMSVVTTVIVFADKPDLSELLIAAALSGGLGIALQLMYVAGVGVVLEPRSSSAEKVVTTRFAIPNDNIDLWLDNVSASVLLVQKDGIVTQANKNALTQLSLSKDKLIGASIALLEEDELNFTSSRVVFPASGPGNMLGLVRGSLTRDGISKMFGTFGLVPRAINEKDASGYILFLFSERHGSITAAAEPMALTEGVKLVDDDRALLSALNQELRTDFHNALGAIDLIRKTPEDERKYEHLQALDHVSKDALGKVEALIDFFDLGRGDDLKDVTYFSIDNLLSRVSLTIGDSYALNSIEVLFDTDSAVSRVIRADRSLLSKFIVHAISHLSNVDEVNAVIIRPRLQIDGEFVKRIEISVSAVMADPDFGLDSDDMPEDGSVVQLDMEIIRRIAAMLRADLTYEKGVEKGKFGFRLVCDIEDSGQIDPGFVIPPYLKNLKAIIVDDNAISRAVMQDHISELGWQADVVASGEAALDLMNFKSNVNAPYDIIVMDWRMPGLDGWETSKKIRAQTSLGTVPIIVMVSAHSPDFLSQNSSERHRVLNGFLTKPITPLMLLDAVVDATAFKFHEEEQHSLPQSGNTRSLSGMKILVVDDNRMNLELAKELLTLKGAKVITANGGYSAINLIQEASDSLNVILMDIRMPDLDGMEATRKIRAMGYMDLPVIMITANPSNAIMEASLKAGAAAVIAKPFRINDLVLKISKYARKNAALNSDQAGNWGPNPEG